MKNGFRKQLGLLNIKYIYIYICTETTLLYYIFFFVHRGLAKIYIYDSIKRPGVRSRGNIFLLLRGKKKLATVYIAWCGNITVSQK